MKKYKIYKLPWKKYDNPNGWLEITTNCQLSCPGCYRGLDKKNCLRFNEDLENLKSQVDWFIKNRNIQSISISGGEPLLYPHLKELVKYIVSKKIYIKIYTNGILLDEKKLIEYKRLGVTEFIIHIDSSQKRPNGKTENELNLLREKYCNLFRKVGSINLGFIMPIGDFNFEELNNLLDFYLRNADIINLVVFTIYNPEITLNKEKTTSLKSIAKVIEKKFKILPSAYLSKTISKKISWLFFSPIISNNKVIGYISPYKYKRLQERYYSKKKKYFITIRRKILNQKKLFWLLGLKGLKNKTAHSQTILIIDSPSKTSMGWDLCKGCPDPVLFNNELVPSCLLERIKQGENIKL